MASSRWYQGPASVEWNDVDLGDTEGGVTVTIETNDIFATADKSGATPVRAFRNGVGITVVVPLLEHDFAALNAAFPEATWDGTAKTFEEDGDFTDMTSYAKELVVTPLAAAHAGKTTTVHLALATAPDLGGYTDDGQKIINLTFMGLKDETNDKIFTLGVDES